MVKLHEEACILSPLDAKHILHYDLARDEHKGKFLMFAATCMVKKAKKHNPDQ